MARPARTPDQIIADAVARGAVSAAGAARWQARAARGEDITIVDQLQGGTLTDHVKRLYGVGAAGSGPVYRQAAPPGTDPTLFAANPLVDETQRDRPALLAAAMAEDPNPPRLFEDRDLPLFTASGRGRVGPRRTAVAAAPPRRSGVHPQGCLRAG